MSDSVFSMVLTKFPSSSNSYSSLPFGSTSFTGLLAQYAYGDVLGYLSDIGSTESQMERSEVPAVPEMWYRISSLPFLAPDPRIIPSLLRHPQLKGPLPINS